MNGIKQVGLASPIFPANGSYRSIEAVVGFMTVPELDEFYGFNL